MPVTDRSTSTETILQREQYAKGGLGRRYWDYRDGAAISCLDAGDRRVVDLGCGEGITLEKLVRQFPDREVTGLDLLAANIEICRRHGLPARQVDARRIDLADGSVDAVLFLEVIEHLDQPEAALREIRRVLRSGGKLVTVFPNDRVFALARWATLRFREARYDPGHVRQWTPRDLRRVLGAEGFGVTRSRSIPFGWWPICLHAVVCAVKE